MGKGVNALDSSMGGTSPARFLVSKPDPAFSPVAVNPNLVEDPFRVWIGQALLASAWFRLLRRVGNHDACR